MKWMSFLFFGLSTALLVILIFPIMKLLYHPKERFQRQARRFVSASFRFFIRIMSFIGIVTVDVDDRESFRHLNSVIISPNHPSLLDVVMMISLIPNADCIVRGNMTRNIVWGVIRQLYISNALDFDELSAACGRSLDQGNCVIIFPEGTRTRWGEEFKLKRGAARIALLTGRAIVPIHIGSADKYGLGKKDPWTAFNHTEKYIYRIRMQPPISPESFQDMDMSRAARRLTDSLRETLLNPPNS